MKFETLSRKETRLTQEPCDKSEIQRLENPLVNTINLRNEIQTSNLTSTQWKCNAMIREWNILNYWW